MAPYDTGWINRSDWTNVHLGSTTTKDTDSNVAHNLNAPLYKLFVKVLVSTDGTDNNSFDILNQQVYFGGVDVARYGMQVYQVDSNNIKVQTAANGIIILDDNGIHTVVDSQDWYYKVRVYYLG